MNNAAIKQQIDSKIQVFRSLSPSTDNATIRDQYHTVKELINNLFGATADEKEIYLQAANVVNLFSREDEAYFVKTNGSDTSHKTAALARLQQWAKRAGDLLQE
ncbi:hypothetical protein [Spirosoma validum]|uniref:Uncharacterized protein n=1 Tax=Spirosoma validum TaxID=2771355 RepID=A0A927B7H1_9BACT|nr:hypothetical protein [Spirosoma validum]MBD2757144.1 hypothetical protein [Spirosoma validum]